MPKRRTNGEGSIRRRNGKWEGRIIVGHKVDGRPIFRYLYADTQKELTAKLRQSLHAYEGVELTEDSDTTFGQWLDRWLAEYAAATLRPNTLAGYRSDIDNHVKPTLGQKPLGKLTADDLHKLYDHLLREGRLNRSPSQGLGLSASTVQGIHTTLHSALKTAVAEGLIPSNPAEGVSPPKGEAAPKGILTCGQMDIFLNAIRDDAIWHDFFYTEITTGLRRGELCGLRWEDFDAAGGTLKICRTVHAKGIVGDTKTYAGTRTIQLPASTAQLLRERQKTALTDWTFPNPLKPEEPMNPSSAYNQLKKLLRDAGLPSIRFHDLRHTFATHALASGVDAKTLSGILGHTKASFTLDTYTHVTGEMQRRAATIVGDFMTDILGKEWKPWQGEATAAST